MNNFLSWCVCMCFDIFLKWKIFVKLIWKIDQCNDDPRCHILYCTIEKEAKMTPNYLFSRIKTCLWFVWHYIYALDKLLKPLCNIKTNHCAIFIENKKENKLFPTSTCCFDHFNWDAAVIKNRKFFAKSRKNRRHKNKQG